MLRYLTFQECPDIIPGKYNKHKIKLQWQTCDSGGKISGYYLGAANHKHANEFEIQSVSFWHAKLVNSLSQGLIFTHSIWIFTRQEEINCCESPILKRIMCNRINYWTIFDIILDYYQFTHYKTKDKYLKHTVTIRNLELCHTMYICTAHDCHHKTKNISLTGTNSSISTLEMEGFLCEVSKIHPVNCHNGSIRGVEV